MRRKLQFDVAITQKVIWVHIQISQVTGRQNNVYETILNCLGH